MFENKLFESNLILLSWPKKWFMEVLLAIFSISRTVTTNLTENILLVMVVHILSKSVENLTLALDCLPDVRGQCCFIQILQLNLTFLELADNLRRRLALRHEAGFHTVREEVLCVNVAEERMTEHFNASVETEPFLLVSLEQTINEMLGLVRD